MSNMMLTRQAYLRVSLFEAKYCLVSAFAHTLKMITLKLEGIFEWFYSIIVNSTVLLLECLRYWQPEKIMKAFVIK